MEERNKYLEQGGLVLDNDEFEWFLDKTTTQYAHQENVNGISLKNLTAYVVRDKNSGGYSRVLVDNESRQAIHETSSLEGMGAYIDGLKACKWFDSDDNE